MEGCQSGQMERLGKPWLLWAPWVRIPPPPHENIIPIRYNIFI